jgi:hypothetical protein
MLQLFRAESNGASWVEEAVVQEHAGHPCKHQTCHNDRQQLHQTYFGNNKRHSISTLQFLRSRQTFRPLLLTTSETSDLRHPLSHLTVYQKGTHYTGIKVFNSLPVPIKNLSHNRKQFKSALKNCLYFH